MSLDFVLPWPPSALSPNARWHWSKLAKAKKRYRTACWGEVLLQMDRKLKDIPQHLAMDLEFVPPDRRAYDDDNLSARFKAGRDGMCDALLFDDFRIRSTTVKVASKPVKGGAVHVRLREAKLPASIEHKDLGLQRVAEDGAQFWCYAAHFVLRIGDAEPVEFLSRVDKALVDLNGNTAAERFRHDRVALIRELEARLPNENAAKLADQLFADLFQRLNRTAGAPVSAQRGITEAREGQCQQPQ